MAKTLQNFIDAVTGHLGNRSGGTIGTQSMADSIASAINNGISKISKQYRLPILDRTLQTTVEIGTKIYDLPTLDTNNNPIRLRNLLRVHYLDSTGEGYPLTKISMQEYDEHYPPSTSGDTGTPIYYAVFAGQIHLYPTPELAGYLVYRATIWPTAMSSLDAESPLGEDWDDVLEEYATAECFAKLQQTLDARLWLDMYRKSLRETIYAMSEEPDDLPNAVDPVSRFSISDPVNNPLVMRYN